MLRERVVLWFWKLPGRKRAWRQPSAKIPPLLFYRCTFMFLPSIREQKLLEVSEEFAYVSFFHHSRPNGFHQNRYGTRWTSNKGTPSIYSHRAAFLTEQQFSPNRHPVEKANQGSFIVSGKALLFFLCTQPSKAMVSNLYTKGSKGKAFSIPSGEPCLPG